MTSALPQLAQPARSITVAHLFITMHQNLLKLAARLGAEADAEDLVAEAYCQLYKNWDALHSPELAAGYLRATIRNLTRMRLRHLTVARRHAEHHRVDELVHSAEYQVIRQNDQQRVADALRKLPLRQYQVLVLRYWMDLREAEIAEVMGISVGAIKSHASRGMTKLTEMMKSDLFTP